MKSSKLRVAIALLGLAAVVTVVSSVRKVQADSSPHADVSGFCSYNDNFGHSHGECVSIAQANVNALAGNGIADAVAICKILEGVFGPFPLGQCVSHFASY